MEGSQELRRTVSRRGWAVCTGAVLAVVVAWGAYTQHAWEDFYISFRASRNLAAGDGLVYHVGERLHTFTSPLHTLLLAALAFFASPGEEATVTLWLYRIVGGIALGSAVFLVVSLGRALAWPRVALAVGAGLVACDAKSIDFTVSGMETPLLLFFLALSLHALLRGKGWRQLGIAWAGMMWTRPDAFVFIGASFAGMVCLGWADETGRRHLLGRAWRAALVATLLYGPWLIWATSYYGSPVPNTVVAKGLVHYERSLRTLVKDIAGAPLQMFVNGKLLPWVFGATYTRAVSDWGELFHAGWRLLALPAWVYWLNPWGGRRARAVSLTFFLATLYGATVPFAPWYAPPYALVAAVTWGFIFSDLWRCTELGATGDDNRGRRLRWWVAGFAVMLVGVQGATSAVMARTMRVQQEIIETGHRREIGRWLRTEAQRGETVFLECVGYIGYFSGLKMLDFPGLTSTEVLAARRKLQSDSFGRLIVELKPDWLVLRSTEVEEVDREVPGLLQDVGGKRRTYERVRVFDRTEEVRAVRGRPGRLYLEMDHRFEVYRRRRMDGDVTKASNPRE